MPELPEVELVAQSLNNLVKGRKILIAELLRERLAPENQPEDFAGKLKDSTIVSVHRRGKHILFDLDNGQTLIAHLRMSGRFQLLPFERENPKFTHAVFYFADEDRLIFSDQRHFGFMKIVETAHLSEAKEIKKLAPEPFSDVAAAPDDGIFDMRRARNVRVRPNDRIFNNGFFFNVNAFADNGIYNARVRFYHAARADD